MDSPRKQRLDDLMSEINVVNAAHANQLSRKLAKNIQPFIVFADRYAPAIDVVAQGIYNPAAIVWGLLRASILALKSFSRYLDDFMAAINRLGLLLSIFAQYEILVGHDPIFRKIVSDVYESIIVFLQKSKSLFSKSGLGLLISSIWRDFETKFYDVLQNINSGLESLERQVTVVYRSELMTCAKLQQDRMGHSLQLTNEIVQSNRENNLREWLQPCRFDARLRELLALRSPDSCKWLLHLPQFESWCESPSGFLWVHGPPECGKSVLGASIIRHFQTTRSSQERLAYYFFDFADPQTTPLVRMLGTLLSQLLSGRTELSSNIYSVYVRAHHMSQNIISEVEALNCFTEILRSHANGNTIILDGLDESQECAKVADLLLRVNETVSNVRILVLSRDVHEVRKVFGAQNSIGITRSMTKADIETFLRREVDSLTHLTGSLERARILTKLQAGADGSFLWAKIMISRLGGAISPAHVSEILETTSGCDGLVNKSVTQLASLPPQQREVVQKAIYWVCCARMPLTLEQLQSAIAIRKDAIGFDANHKPFLQVLANLISPLFTTSGISGAVKPLHASVLECLIKPSQKGDEYRLKSADLFVDKLVRDGDIALLSLKLMQSVLRDKDWEAFVKGEPLFPYCAVSWLDHLLASGHKQDTHDEVIGFLSSECRARWLFYWLQSQRQLFPLRKILRLRERLCEWLGLSASETSFSYLHWDYDICNALAEMFLGNKMEVQSGHGALGGSPRTQVSHLTYFEKMMIVRDLARHLTQHKSLPQGIQLFEEKLNNLSHAAMGASVDGIWILSTLGILYDQAGHHDLATRVQEDNLSALGCSTSATVGSEAPVDKMIHAQLIWTKNELGRMYRHQKRYQLARQMHMDALQALKSEKFTEDDFSSRMEIAWTQSTLARVYRCEKDYENALAYSSVSSTTRLELLGPSHPHTLWLQSDMAQIFLEQGDYEKAIELHRCALHHRRKVLGDADLDTCWTMNNLAVALEMRTKPESSKEAKSLHQEAFNIQNERLGSCHPHTQWTRAKLDNLG